VGGIPYEKFGDACRLALGYKSRFLLSVWGVHDETLLFSAVKVAVRVHSKK